MRMPLRSIRMRHTTRLWNAHYSTIGERKRNGKRIIMVRCNQCAHVVVGKTNVITRKMKDHMKTIHRRKLVFDQRNSDYFIKLQWYNRHILPHRVGRGRKYSLLRINGRTPSWAIRRDIRKADDLDLSNFKL